MISAAVSSSSVFAIAETTLMTAETIVIITVHQLSHVFIAESIETVYDVEHGIAIDGVVLGVAALRATDGSADITLLAQNVVKL